MRLIEIYAHEMLVMHATGRMVFDAVSFVLLSPDRNVYFYLLLIVFYL